VPLPRLPLPSDATATGVTVGFLLGSALGSELANDDQ